MAKDKQDRSFHCDPTDIGVARDSVRHRIEPSDSGLRIADEEEDEEDAQQVDERVNNDAASSKARR